MTTLRDQYFQTLTKTYPATDSASMNTAFPNVSKPCKHPTSTRKKPIASGAAVPKLSHMLKFQKASDSHFHDFFICLIYTVQISSI